MKEYGKCDTCKNNYLLGDRISRCGNCGNCGNCCKHKKGSESMNITCDNCDTGNLATHTVITLSGELALCEPCYKD